MEHLQEQAIWHNTFRIPWPYTEADAEDWIEERIQHRTEQPAETTFVLRTPDGRLTDIVGADDLDVCTTHRARLGYWLAKPYWERGLMTEAVLWYVDRAPTELVVMRLTTDGTLYFGLLRSDLEERA